MHFFGKHSCPAITNLDCGRFSCLTFMMLQISTLHITDAEEKIVK